MCYVVNMTFWILFPPFFLQVEDIILCDGNYGVAAYGME